MHIIVIAYKMKFFIMRTLENEPAPIETEKTRFDGNEI